MSIVVKQEKVTPAKARKWLATANEGNRRLRKATVSAYARDMVAGDWRVTGESLKFNKEGRLVDGQHRLHAIIESLTSIDSLIVRGVDEDAHHVLDTGAKRSLTDVLHYEGQINCSVLAAAIRFTILHDRGLLAGHTSGAGTLSVSECLSWLRDNPSFVSSVNYMVRLTTAYGAIKTPMVAIRFKSHFIPGKADEFVQGVVTGEGLGDKDPRRILRKYLEYAYARSGRLHSARQVQACTIKAWNSYAVGEEISGLRFNAYGERRESFPVIFTGENMPEAFDE